MMTKEEHIQYWLESAEYDWKAAQDLFKPKSYKHCLVCVHIALEKIAKAHWVKTHDNHYPPKIDNIMTLLEQSNVTLDEETITFLTLMNDFQVEEYYPDYTHSIYKRCTEEYTREQLNKAEEVKQCLLKML
jgi:HEPN domain-containing protein